LPYVETRGRKPLKDEEDRVRNGLFESQWAELERLAKQRKITVSQLRREIIDWYITAMHRESENPPLIKEEFIDMT